MSNDEDEDSGKQQDLSKEERLERRRRILALKNQGKPIKDIALAEGVSQGTVKRDLAIAQTDSVKEIKNFNRERFLGDTVSQYDDIYRACWNIYDENPNDPDIKLKALTAARMTLGDKRKAMQDTGVVKKDLGQLGGTLINLEIVAGLSEEEIRRFSQQLIASQALTTELLLPEPELDDNITDAEIVVEPVLDEEEN